MSSLLLNNHVSKMTATGGRAEDRKPSQTCFLAPTKNRVQERPYQNAFSEPKALRLRRMGVSRFGVSQGKYGKGRQEEGSGWCIRGVIIMMGCGI